MKRFLCIILAILSLSLLAFAADVSVKLDGKALKFEQPPVIIEERTLVPLRAIFEALGAKVEWEDSTKTVTATKDNIIVKAVIGSNNLYKNDAVSVLDVPPQIVGEGYTMVPVRAISEAFDVKVDWDDSTKTVILTTPQPEIDGIVLMGADAEDPDNLHGLYSTSAEPISIVKDPIMEDNNVYFLDSNVKDTAAWTYLKIDTQFKPGCTYIVEYDVLLGDDVYGNKLEKATMGTNLRYAPKGLTTIKDHSASTTINAGAWTRVSHTFEVPDDYNTKVKCMFGIYANPAAVAGYNHNVAFDFYVDNIVVAPADSISSDDTDIGDAKDVYFVGSTTKNALEYKAGETMTFKLGIMNGSKSVTAPFIQYICTGDDGKTSQGYVAPSEDGYYYFDTKCDTAGFVRVIAKICNKNKRALSEYTPFEGGAGADVDKIKCDTPEPDDYLKFWDNLKKTAFALDNEVIYEKDLDARPGFVAKDMRLKTAEGAGDYASFIITYPENATPGSLKLRMIFMGYGVTKASASYKSGYITVYMNTHDIPNDLTTADYDRIKSQKYQGYGWKTEENQKPETSYWWKVFIRNMQVYNYATNLSLFDGKNVEYSGDSQGGFQSCNMAAHTPLAVQCSIGVPWFGNLAGAKVSGRQNGWYPEPDAGLCYFDTAIAAKYIKCDTDITRAGLGDYTSSPSSVMAIYNALSCKKSLSFNQNSTHSYIGPSCANYKLSNK